MPFGIQKKFAAAICMLLVASLMMVSTTYAWFTLSTAPEVTGITTNVGANGNLEIVLLNDTSFYSSEDDLGIKSGTQDSMETKAVTEANETWGNLVDLSDPTYGLAKMILNPAALNFTDTATIGNGLHTLLRAPSYGSDGRVIDVATATQTGKYLSNRFAEGGGTIGGVRVIGVSSGITLRISTYREARASISSYLTLAKQNASSSLVDNGQDLANLLMAYVATGEGYTLSATDIAALDAVVTALENSLDAVADAIRAAALTYALSTANATELTDDQVTAMASAIKTAPATVADLTAVTGVDVSAVAELSAVITKYAASKANLTTARTTVNGLSTSSTYASASGALDNLILKEHMSVAGVTNPGSDSVSTIASNAMTAGRIDVQMLSGSGIYAEIAEMVGNYTASGLRLTLDYEGIHVQDLPATMSTAVTGDAMLLTAASAVAIGEGASSGSVSIDDPYGYIVDFGFRTNAAGSDLLLDLAGSQRVYDEENFTNDATQGQGCYLEFVTRDRNSFSVADVEKLMGAIRVVFVTPNNLQDGYEILGIASPEIDYSTDNQTGTISVVKGNSVVETVSDSDNTATVRAELRLRNYTVKEIPNTTNEFQLNLGSVKLDTAAEEANTPYVTLTALEQNKAKKVSVLVYLDGDIVDNSFVANSRESMTGKLNLQFKSSAELQPMDVTSMREAGGNGTQVITQTVGYAELQTAITAIKANAIYTAAEAADPRSEEQTALLNAVSAAEALSATASESDIAAATTTLYSAATAAGITFTP